LVFLISAKKAEQFLLVQIADLDIFNVPLEHNLNYQILILLKAEIGIGWRTIGLQPHEPLNRKQKVSQSSDN
jgi:hypothetical protein